MEKFKWVVEFEVDKSWVADGFNLTNAKALEMISNALPFADADEYDAKVIQAPAEVEAYANMMQKRINSLSSETKTK